MTAATQTPEDSRHWLDELNPEQRAAACHGIGDADGSPSGPLLVIAGAGTGKTGTLAHRVANLVIHGTDPSRILLLTFSRRAADEMGRRVRRILARAAVDHAWLAQVQLPWSGTFHAVGARLLRDFAGRIGLDAGFTIHDREDSADLMNLVRHEAGLSARERRFPLKNTCLAIYSAAVNARKPLREVLRASFPWCLEWEDELKRLFRAYVEAKQAQQVLDYDDLLLYWAHMVADPALAAELGGLFDHVLVDEYQDTNPLQAAILLAMKPDGRGLAVVGDDAQAIYGFRGATVRNILDFPAQFDPPAQRIVLSRNYRSTRPILEAANAVIAMAGEGFAKDLWTAREEGVRPRLVSVRDDADQVGFIVDEVLARREQGMSLRQQAVLFRAASHSARLEMELTRRNIPFVKFGGLKFLEAAHVKDVLALLRWLENPRDRVSGFRVLQLLGGIGPKTAAKVLDNVCAAPDGCALLAEQPVPEAAREAWREFAALAESLNAAHAPWPAAFEAACTWYVAQMPRLYEDAAIRQGDIEQLQRIAATYPGRRAFLTELTLDPPNATSDEAGIPLRDEDYLILSTMHSAKGQEWRAVTVLNVVDGCIPSDMATGVEAEIDEERRLLYVAMTRARDVLDLIVPQRFYVTQQQGLGDRHVYAGRSRFIPNRLLPCFEQMSWPEPPPELRGTPDSRQAAIDLAAKMRGMWD
jgi:DNA helicase-2/ATP-dependent DNA helicase PcrA